jgi:hypothetical protein
MSRQRSTKELIMNDKSSLVHPHHCFCEIPDKELLPWVQKRYGKDIPTVKLLHSTDDPRQKEIIGIVALLDVDERMMLELMGEVSKPEHHIIHCRENVKRMLGLD